MRPLRHHFWFYFFELPSHAMSVVVITTNRQKKLKSQLCGNGARKPT
jgi:hypothetical protein